VGMMGGTKTELDLALLMHKRAELRGTVLRARPLEEKILAAKAADEQVASPEAARAEGVRIAQEMLEAVRPYVQGVQVSAPFGRYVAAAEVIGSVLPPGGM